MHASKLLNNAEQNYNATKIEALTMVFALHKFKHHLLGNKFVFYIGLLGYKPQVLGVIVRWLLLFLEYDLT
jgi:hypothetical protein